MGSFSLIIIGGLTVLVSKAYAAEAILPRSFPSCGFVGNQIYCWGGDTAASLTSDFSIDQNLYSLNIAQFSGQATDSMSNKWEKIIPSAPYYVAPRRTPSAIVLPDKKRFLFNGGFNMNYNKFGYQSCVYDTTTNSWSSVMSYGVEGKGTRQIYSATAVILPNQLVGYFGGMEQVANTSNPVISASGVQMPFDASNGTVVGFTEVQTYTPGAKAWTAFTPQLNPPANYYPNSQTATIDPASGKIYYLGGSYYTPTSNGPIRAPLSWGYTFNTNNGDWLNETYTGIIPTNRLYHSADLMPNSRDILLFGGTDDGNTASLDNCFTLNLISNTWTKQGNVNIPSQFNGNRFSHSSVLVNTTLFILFGRGPNGDLSSSSMFTLDVRDVANITYAPIFNVAVDAAVPNANNNGTGTGTGNGSKTGSDTAAKEGSTIEPSGLSNGAIGGIAAGCAVFGLAIIGFIIFYIRRQKNAKRRKSKDQDEINDETLHVDWDKIDDQYREVPPVIGVVHSPQSSTNSSTEHTKVGSPQAGSPQVENNNSPIPTIRSHYSPKLVDTNVVSDNQASFDEPGEPPNAADPTYVKPSVAQQNYFFVKPDGS